MSAQAAVLEHAEPIFQSAHQALLFAYTFTPNQYAPAAVAERQVAMWGRERYERALPRRPSRGLTGLDGAAQAGMIHASVMRLGQCDQAFIGARFDVLAPRRRAWWIDLVAWHMRALVTHEPLLADLAGSLSCRHFGADDPVPLDQLAEYYAVSRATVFRKAAAMRKMILDHADRAMMRIDDELVERGIVGIS